MRPIAHARGIGVGEFRIGNVGRLRIPERTAFEHFEFVGLVEYRIEMTALHIVFARHARADPGVSGKGGGHILDLELVGFLRTEDVEILGFEQPADDLLAVLPASGLLVAVVVLDVVARHADGFEPFQLCAAVAAAVVVRTAREGRGAEQQKSAKKGRFQKSVRNMESIHGVLLLSVFISERERSGVEERIGTLQQPHP